jgi:cullin-associated NEDD8-dissociated protein 1
MASSNTQPASAYNVGHLLPKLEDEDPDLRYMGLNDLCQMLAAAPNNIFSNDISIPAKTIEALLRCLKDQNGEVQNMAVKCVGPFVNKVNEQIVCVLIEKISLLDSDSVVDSSIPALALRQIVISLPRPGSGVTRTKPVNEAYNAISKAMIPRLTGYTVIPHSGSKNLPKPPPSMLAIDMEKGTDSNAMDVLIEVANCFGTMLRESETTALTKVSLSVIRSERTSQVLKRKAVAAMSHFAVYLSDQLLLQFIEQVVQDLSSNTLTKSHRKLYFSLLGSVARSIPDKFAAFMPTLCPFVLQSLSQEEIDNDHARMEETEERDPEADEIREAALLALESWLATCSEAMRPVTTQSLEIITRFLKYDPNLADDDVDEMEEDEDILEGDDFEEDIGGDDEDDTSWKVRRCAAKLAQVLITTRSNGDLLDDGTLYKVIAPALINRFKDSEETVRLEVLAALSKLIRITGGEPFSLDITSTPLSSGAMAPPPSRKRRRVGSDASMVDVQNTSFQHGQHASDVSPPSSKAFKSLETLSPQLVQGLANLMQNGPLPTKEASIIVLRDLVLALHGKLTGYLQSTLPTIITAVTQSGASTTASVAATNAYRVEALTFLGSTAEVQSLQDLQPYLDKIIPVIISATKDKYTKVSVAALTSLENYIHVLTPPRSSSADTAPYLNQLGNALSYITSSNEADLEVRRLAIHALGVLLGQSALAPGLLSSQDRVTGMQLLLNRLSNETTRLAAARAVDSIASLSKNPSDYPQEWAPAVANILVEQFRKSSRSLRGASVSAMKTLALNPATNSQFTREWISRYLPELEPLIKSSDFHLMGPALLILASFIHLDPQNPGFTEFIPALCTLLVSNLPSTTLQSLISVIRAFGTNQIGKNLMTALLRDVSLKASPEIVGKAIGNLLVAGGDTVGVTIDMFVSELDGDSDDTRKCLALSVLGETSCLLATNSTLTPDFFVGRFKKASDAVGQAAAGALGRAGVGNVSVYVPVILSAISKSKSTKDKTLLLHAVREIVNSECHGELAPFVQDLWNQVMAVSQTDEGKAVGSECIGRLAVIEPTEFFPQLEKLLTDPNSSASLRNLVLSALRVTVTSDSPAAHTPAVGQQLLPLIKAVLSIIPDEKDLEDRRVELTIINAVAHTRLDEVLLPMLMDVIPVVVSETKVRQELIREVQMGPFKHKVDDGLEFRKVINFINLSMRAVLTPYFSRPHTNVSTRSSPTRYFHPLCFQHSLLPSSLGLVRIMRFAFSHFFPCTRLWRSSRLPQRRCFHNSLIHSR